MKRAIVTLIALAAPATAAAQEPFYLPAGDLIPGSGEGLADETVYAPGMRYPIEHGPSFPNSQVYGIGGNKGPAGSQCNPINYDYPWRDNYCETRSWDMPLCPAGIGHQGQDIRPPTCEKDKHWVVAGRPGEVTNIGTYSVYVTSADGQRLDYLHGAVPTLQVVLGQQVATGDKLVAVSNNMGDTPTSIHLHFNIRQDVAGVGFAYVSPYMSLVRAYEALMGWGNKAPTGALDKADCASLLGWAQDPDAPDTAIAVELSFGGPKGEPGTTLVEVLADRERPDLCQQLGSCAHGFEVEVPLSLRDGQTHALHVYAMDDGQGAPVEVDLSPGTFQCATPPLPTGVKRHVPDPEALAAWQLSPFWQGIALADPDLAALPDGKAMPDRPILAQSSAEPGTIWLIDQGTRRPLNEADVTAWQLDPTTAETWAPAYLQALPEGPPLRPTPVLVKGTGPEIYVVDDPLCVLDEDAPGCAVAGSEGGEGGSEEGGQVTEGGASAGPDPGGNGSSSDGAGSAGLPPNFGEESGCGCSQDAGAGGLMVLVLAGLRRRRRDAHARGVKYMSR